MNVDAHSNITTEEWKNRDKKMLLNATDMQQQRHTKEQNNEMVTRSTAVR